MKKYFTIQKLVLAAMFMAVGIVLPFVTGQIPQIGKMLCPMHIPVLLSGFFIGAPLALIVGLITPLLRSVMFGFPMMVPNAVCMCFELAAYGAVAGVMYELACTWKMNRVVRIYVCLIAAMLAGRLVGGVASVAVYRIIAGEFTMSMFVAGYFTGAVPGIILQLVLIPLLVDRLIKYVRN